MQTINGVYMKIGILMSTLFQQSFVNLVNSKNKMPVALGMKILKLKRFLSEQVQDAEAIKQDIINKYAARDESGELIIKDDNYEIAESPEFVQDWSEFLSTDVEIPLNVKLTEEEFYQLNIEVTVNELQVLMDNLMVIS